MATGKYDNVLNYFGESVEHYGKKDVQSYFAEKCFQIDVDQMTGEWNAIMCETIK